MHDISSTTTTIRTHDDHETVLGATITGKEVNLKANKDINATAATIVGQNDVNVTAGRNINTTSDTQSDNSSTYVHVKSSGIMGAGMGLFIGTKKTTDTVDGAYKTQVGTTIASSNGKVNISAHDTAHLTTTDVVGKHGIDITAHNITLDGKQNESHETQVHEESSSRLSFSLGGSVASTINTARANIQQANNRNNKTLKALEYYEAGKEVRKDISTIKQNHKNTNDTAVKDNLVNIHVGLGSSSSRQEVSADNLQYAGGSLTSDSTITLTAKTNEADKGNIHAIGETIIGKDVTLQADKNITLKGAENQTTITTNASSKGWSVGATVGPAQGSMLSVDANAYKGKENGVETQTTHTQTKVIGTNTIHLSTGKNLTMTGAQVAGTQVQADIGDNLRIESQQDTHDFHSQGRNFGIGVTMPIGGVISGSASSTNTKIDSTYRSVTEQSGISAGKEGFQINVKDNTTLKGGVIASSADANTNSLTTGSLTMEDIRNNASYTASSKGWTYNRYGDSKTEKDYYNEKGLTSNLLPSAKDTASSATQSAIAPGNLDVKDNKVDLNAINRDTANTLHKLGEIFDKQTVEEHRP